MIDYSKLTNAFLAAFLPWALGGVLVAIVLMVIRTKLERWLDEKLGREQPAPRRSGRH